MQSLAEAEQELWRCAGADGLVGQTPKTVRRQGTWHLVWLFPFRKRCYADSRVILDSRRILRFAPNVFEMGMIEVVVGI